MSGRMGTIPSWEEPERKPGKRKGTVARANRVVVFFGKYRGQSLEQIGAHPEGLRYLDWMYRKAVIRQPGLQDAIGCYLNHPAVAPTLNALLGA